MARLRGSFSLRLAVWRALRGGHFAPTRRSPARLIDLAAASDGKGVGRNIFSNRPAGADVGAISDFRRSHKRGVASDKNATANGGRIFVHAIVIARDRACADVGFASDTRVAEVGKVHGLCALSENGVFDF